MDMPSSGAPSYTAGPRIAPRNPRRHVRVLAGLVGAVLLAGCQVPSVAGQSPPDGTDYPVQPPADTLTGPAPVSRVVDGDTLWVKTDDGDTKVRLIGIDTPELVDPRTPVQCFAQEASDFTKSALTGQLVYLEDDPSQDSTDRYGRRLAYVWTLDGRLINLDLIAEGYANEYTYSTPYRYQRQFRAAEAAAAEQDRGLWNPKTCAAQR
ncbi:MULTISPECIES: thermonuclease family protein [Mycolicibacterium]|uniref:Nuclease n=2 Tax=Mycolicibacterium TaxID=1866885 RepID=A0AAW5SMW9_MYCNV|nr:MULTISPECIES: thermonuclease family protein [Mycolicibacterium]EHB45844.1 nuclease (SNase domain-containing protein) [Mycolicibacterium rhodesiae JS60]MCV7024388.1 thermonuclease family protein [Mycolicibacterium novocastrense]MDG5486564.1 thermonuclease family protein [Mycolicibacterium gadium]GAT12010.1 nuclease [Mycolicibacterium novocastrense]